MPFCVAVRYKALAGTVSGSVLQTAGTYVATEADRHSSLYSCVSSAEGQERAQVVRFGETCSCVT